VRLKPLGYCMADHDVVRGVSETGDPLLLTPGDPLTTSKAAVKEVMVHDWGSRDGRIPEDQSRSPGAAACPW